MIQTVVKTPSFTWLDVDHPSKAELQTLAKTYGLHQALVEDVLDPEHLPKVERVGDVQFVLLRAHDVAAPASGDTVQELTRKLAIFSGKDYVISIHRVDQPYLSVLKRAWEGGDVPPDAGSKIVRQLIEGVVRTYDGPIEAALAELDQLEMAVFGASPKGPRFDLKRAYYLKRRAFIFKRMLRATLDTFHKARGAATPATPEDTEITDLIEGFFFSTEELTESVTNLLNLQLSLASHRTNEVMRVLTVFSVFLLPLNVIAGIYGMNFEFMPELKWRWGYPFALACMLAVSTLLLTWFKRRGWLGLGSSD